jgi:hypothetical protein
VRIFVATQPVDGRKGVDSLATIVSNAFALDPLSGHLFVFFSRRRDRVRIIYWDTNGFAMWGKRLEQGRFHALLGSEDRLSVSAIDRTSLLLILEGVDLGSARRRPRWEPRRPPPTEPAIAPCT